MKKLTILAVSLIFLLSACQSIQTPTAEPTPETALFFDDFSGDTLAWSAFGEGTQLPALSEGAAHFPLTTAGMTIAAATGGQYPADVIVQSDVTISEDASMHAWGVFCRYDAPSNKAYMFYVAKFSEETGRMAALSVYDPDSGQTSTLFEQFLTDELAETNRLHIEVSCIGPRLSLSLNDQNIAVYYDTQLSGTDAGMFAFGDGGSGEVQFDNFAVMPVSADQSAGARLPTAKPQ